MTALYKSLTDMITYEMKVKSLSVMSKLLKCSKFDTSARYRIGISQ